MTADEMLSMLGATVVQHPGWLAFAKHMKHRTYGHVELLAAWAAFRKGWEELDR